MQEIQCYAESGDQSPTYFKLGTEFFPETDRDAFLPGAENNQSRRSVQEHNGKQQQEEGRTSKKIRRSAVPWQTNKRAVSFALDAVGKISATIRIIQVTKPDTSKFRERSMTVDIYRTELGFWFDTLRTQARVTVDSLRNKQNKHPSTRRQIDYASLFSTLGDACEKGFEVAKSGYDLAEQIKEGKEEEEEEEEKRRNAPSATTTLMPSTMTLQLLLERYPKLKAIDEPVHSANDACIAQQTSKPIYPGSRKIDQYKAVFTCDISRKLDEITLTLTRFRSGVLHYLTNAFSYIEKRAEKAAIAMLTIKVKVKASKSSKATRRGEGEDAIFDGAGKLCGAKMTLIGGLVQMISEKKEEADEEKGGSGMGGMSDMLGMFG